MSSKSFLTFLFLLLPLGMTAQEEPDWQSVWNELMNTEDADDDNTLNTYELLQQLSEQPLNINCATRQELEQLPFLSAQQVMNLQEYLYHYGPMRSINELRMVRSMDTKQLALLPFFIYIGEKQDSLPHAGLKNAPRHGRHQLTTAARLPLYERQGDRNGYLGYRYRHWLRYEFSYSPYLKAGIVGAQDAGEPFLSNRNRWGYDAYSVYLQLQHCGVLDNLVAGKYHLSSGMGLVLNNSFSLGKLAMLQNMGRTANNIRPHASRSVADYFQGAAATWTVSRPLKLTVFGSYRPLDATLNSDGTARTIVTDGYHRTPTEMQKKHNTWLTSAGGILTYRKQGWQAGLTAAYSHLDRRLSPNTKTLYLRHAAQGNDFVNVGAHYGFTRHKLSFQGETAMNGDGALATLNTVSLQPSARWRLMALQRFYSYRYTSLHAHAFSEAGHVQNESGLYVGATWMPLSGWQLSGYADVAYFPWARYRVSQSSSAKDFLLESSLQRNRWTVKGRYRLHLRELDNSTKTALRRHNEHRARLSFSYTPDAPWSSSTQLDGVRAVNMQIEHGWMVSQQLSYQRRPFMLFVQGAYFDTDSYDSRIYSYERQLPHEYGMPMYYGCGLRLSVAARILLGRHLQINGKWGHTRYFDRQQIGSGLQQIDSNRQTDLDLQVSWLF